MNVLIYAGPEALQKSVEHSLLTLQSILLPHYSVQTITRQALNSQPWESSCGLFVLPQCREGLPSASVKGFVESGGSLLSVGAGAICSDQQLGSAASVSKGVRLGFFDEHSSTYVYLTHDNEDGSDKYVDLEISDGEPVKRIQGSGASRFSGFGGRKGAKILGKYITDDSENSIAGLRYNIGKGRLAIWTPSIENSLVTETSSTQTSLTLELERRRLDLLKKTLTELAIRLPSGEEEPSILHPLPQFLSSNPSAKGTIIPKFTNSIATPSPGSQLSVFKDDNDTFHFHNLSEGAKVLMDARETKTVDSSDWQPKHVIVCPEILPDRTLTPLFDLRAYYEHVKASCKGDVKSMPWGVGDALLYGEVVTSTQTMLDKNPHLLRRLPAPLVSLASYQLAGRGRGSNVWLSPTGCLQFSILLRLSLASLPANKLVFIQYIFALAVVEACRDESVLGIRGDRIRLKWPNDIYAAAEGGKRKIGGILVSTSFSGDQVDVVIGCGLNVLNLPPILSLAQLLHPDQRHNLTLEKTLSSILTQFEKMWETFVHQRGSFDSFMDLYLERWLHSDQLVTLTMVTPPQPVRVVGITPDHGLLRTIPERGGWSGGGEGFIDLQPDGNSFDLMAGLIKAKR